MVFTLPNNFIIPLTTAVGQMKIFYMTKCCSIHYLLTNRKIKSKHSTTIIKSKCLNKRNVFFLACIVARVPISEKFVS